MISTYPSACSTHSLVPADFNHRFLRTAIQALAFSPVSFAMPFGRLTLLATTLGLAYAQKYTLSQDLAGQNFLNAFKYNESDHDPTNYGNVKYLSQSAAVAANLTYVDGNGRVIVKVDNKTSGVGDSTFGRNSVYLMSTQPMNIESLLIFDAAHMPFGCSVWPSLFTQGQNWPQLGVIEIVLLYQASSLLQENVNLETNNRFSLKASDTCVQPSSIVSNQTGIINSTNCTVVPSQGITDGCVVTETKRNSFGSGFASQGGGVFAMLWDANGIAMWYFGRSGVPSNIGGTALPDPATWGKASAWYPASSCDPTKHFGPQTITLYIDICGAFANPLEIFGATCGTKAPNCSSLVQDPANYNDAYWEINYLRVFNQVGSIASTSGSGSNPGPLSTGPGGTSSTNSGDTPKKTSAASVGGARMRELLFISASLLGLLSL
ncbi:Glycoside hydrolase family 16 protein [Mycena venus]|uniref:Glycoside hydrolase family 16 protein n=1 Tax=Mycena venus TaxID=2733690 RepID=A0A8H6XIS8_9AGAR|nr:Glycoside hydrolase family 16 protein [Mycena venus]